MVLKGLRNGLELKFYELALKILKENNLELYDLDWNPSSGSLKIFIFDSRTKTATLDDCVRIDRSFNPYIESEEWMPENLTLEVSSPGLFRQLNAIDHFKDIEGEEITLNLLTKIDEARYPDFPKTMRNNLKIKVKLLTTNNDSLSVEARGVLFEVPFTQIKKANLETNFNNYQPINE